MVASIIFPALIPAGVSGYTIESALWLDGSDDFLSWTPGGAASSDTDKTISFWVKRAKFGSVQWLLDVSSNGDQIQYTSGDALEVSLNATTDSHYTTKALFRDPTAWTHIVIAFDTNSGTAANKKRLWINGVLQEDAVLDNHDDPADDANVDWMKQSIAHNLGRRGNNSQFFAGYLAEFIGLDGTAAQATDFGEYDSNGVWVPIDPTDTVSAGKGNNGFWLEFKDANDIGKDSSGNTDHVRVTTTGGTWANASGFSEFTESRFDDGDYSSARAFKVSGTGNRFTYDHGSGNSFALSQVGMANDNGSSNSAACKWKVEYSDNGSDWTDTSQFCDYTDGGESSTDPQYATITGQSAHRYWAWEVVVDRTAHTSHGTYEVELYEQGASYWTVNSIASTQVSQDTPTDDTDVEKDIYASFDAAAAGSGTLSNNNLTVSLASYNEQAFGSLPMVSGKFYWEVTPTNGSTNPQVIVGICDNRIVRGSDPWSNQYLWGYKTDDGVIRHNGANNSYGSSYSQDDVICIAFDADNGALYFRKNGGSWENSGDPTSGSSKTGAFTTNITAGNVYLPHVGSQIASPARTLNIAFDSSSWAQSAPTGYTALKKYTQGVGNYYTLNPLASTDTLTGGNLSFTGAANFSSYVTAPALPSTGKWYYEITATGSAAIADAASYDTYVGLVKTSVAIPTASHTSDSNLWVWGNPNPTPSGQKFNGTGIDLHPTEHFLDGSIIMIAVDMDNSKIWFGNDGTWAGSGDPAAGSNAAYSNLSGQLMPFQSLYSDSATYNFGQSGFVHAPPTGFKALSSANLPAPAIKSMDKGLVFANATGANIVADLDTAKSDAGWGSDAHIDIYQMIDGSAEGTPWVFSDDPSNALIIQTNAGTTGTPSLSSSDNYMGWSLRVGATYGCYTGLKAHTNGSGDTTQAHGLGSGLKVGIIKMSSTTGEWIWTHPGLTANHNKVMSTTAAETNTQHVDINDTNIVIKSAAPSGTYRLLAFVDIPGFCSVTSGAGNGGDDRFYWMHIKPKIGIHSQYSNGSGYASYLHHRLTQTHNDANSYAHDITNDTSNAVEAAWARLDFLAMGVRAGASNNEVNASGNNYIQLFWGDPVGGSGVAQAKAR